MDNSNERTLVCVITATLTARFALERLLAAVDALVIVQRRHLLEGTSARQAHVRLVIGVVQQVLVVRLLERERFAAMLARVRRFT